MKYFFFQTMNVGGTQRLRPLPFQTDNDGDEIKTGLNTQADRTLRNAYPLGTYFGSTDITLSKGYYSVGHIYPLLGFDIDKYKDLSHFPPEDMTKAFEKFKEEHPDIFSSLKDIFDEAAKSAETSSATMEETLLQQIMRNPIFACPTIEEDGFHITKKDWYFILLNIITGQPLLLTGPTGTGKTEIIKLACRKLGLPLHKYDMGGIHDPMEQLLGSHRLQDGNSYFDYSQFALDIQEKGVILLDELSRAPAETNNILLPLLDETKLLKVEMAGGRDMRSIPVHPECTFIATANIGDEYSGVQKIDEALSDRFLVMEMDYLPEAAEIKVLVKRTEITESQAKIIVKLSHDVREMKKKGEIYGQHSLSTRETLQAARLAHLGYSVKDAIERAFLTRFEGNDLEGDRAIVKALMATL